MCITTETVTKTLSVRNVSSFLEEVRACEENSFHACKRERFMASPEGGVEMKLLALCCFPRREGNTSKALSLLFEKLPNDWQKEIINLYDFNIKACGEVCDVECLKGEDVCKVDAFDERVKLLEKLKTADVIVFGTPTYNMDVPSKLRAFLERDFLEDYLKNKVVALLIVSNLGGVKALCTLTSSLILDAQAIIAGAVVVLEYREKEKD